MLREKEREFATRRDLEELRGEVVGGQIGDLAKAVRRGERRGELVRLTLSEVSLRTFRWGVERRTDSEADHDAFSPFRSDSISWPPPSPTSKPKSNETGSLDLINSPSPGSSNSCTSPPPPSPRPRPNSTLPTKLDTSVLPRLTLNSTAPQLVAYVQRITADFLLPPLNSLHLKRTVVLQTPNSPTPRVARTSTTPRTRRRRQRARLSSGSYGRTSSSLLWI